MAVKRVIKKSSKANEILIEDAFTEFINIKQAKNLSAATIRNYEQSYDFYCRFCGFDSSSTCEEIKSNQIYAWINSLKLDGVKPTSINHYLRDIRTFLYWCMDADRKYIEPAFKVETVVAQEEQLKLFTDEDIIALLEKPKRNAGFVEWRTWAIVNWVLGTGNRASTICEVQIADINFNKKEISLRHTKNKKAQTIPLSSSLETVIKEYMRVWRNGVPASSFLFCNVGEEKMTTNALRLSFGRYCESRGIQQTNIHGLRHNFAKGWIQNNGNDMILQEILGHSSMAMTRHYVKLFKEDLKQDYDKFSPLDTIKKSSRRTQTVKRNR